MSLYRQCICVHIEKAPHSTVVNDIEKFSLHIVNFPVVICPVVNDNLIDVLPVTGRNR